jgi:hypothetical protein
MLHALESKVFTWTMTLLTLYALFGDDFRLLMFTKEKDNFFNFGTLISILAFGTEIVLSCLAKKEEYLFSFYFWLDVISTFSLVFDISWIWDPLTGVDDI